MKPREFKEGDEVLSSMSEVKLLAKWRGPYKVTRRVTSVSYEISSPDQQTESKIYHVNLLKGWKNREEARYMGEELGPSKDEALQDPGKCQVGGELSEKQKEEIKEIQRKYPTIFSKRPGLTNLVTHQVIVKEPKIVR